jgi:hypothetical protein
MNNVAKEERSRRFISFAVAGEKLSYIFCRKERTPRHSKKTPAEKTDLRALIKASHCS